MLAPRQVLTRALLFRHIRQSSTAAALVQDNAELPLTYLEGFPKPDVKHAETIIAIPRGHSGKNISAKERKAGRVPGIVFEQEDGQHGGNKRLISVQNNQIKKLVNHLGRSYFLSRLFDLEVRPDVESEDIIEKVRVLPRLLHLHASTDAVLNVTFIRAPSNALLKVDVPLVFIGDDVSPGLKKGSYLNIIKRTVKFICPADIIPPFIEVDLSELDVGQKLVMGDLKVHPALKLARPKDEPICKIAGARVSEPKKAYTHNYDHLLLNQLLLISKMNTLLVSVILFILTGFYYSIPFMLTLIVLLFLFLAVLLSALLVSYFKELMSNDHRPPVVGSTFNMFIHFDHLFDYMALIAKKHHTFRFITPTHSEVYIADPINVEHILKSNFQNYTKGDHKLILGDLFGNGIFAADGDIWRHQRKLASLEFSTKVLRDFSTAVFRSNTAKLVKKVSDMQIISLQDLLMKSTLDSIFKVGFGFDLDTLSGSDEVSNQFMTAFDDSNCIIFWRYVDLLWRVKRYFSIGSEAALKKNIRVIDNFVYELIERKKEQMKNAKDDRNKEDILSRFLIESEKNPANLTDQYLRDITLSFIIAGKDTTANTLTWFFYMLCKNTLIQEKVALEVKEATGAEYTYSINEFSLKLTEAALDKMHYLHAALTETLRLYPAVPLDGKYSEKDDILPDGFKIKKGDHISYMPYPMGKMTYIWGEDAEEFRPERWLHDGFFQPESPFKFTAFQAGPRICLGKEFAYRQMKIMAAFLVFFFKFHLVDESKEATYRTMFTLHMNKRLFLYAFPRSKP
ncbi:hypothetical protein SSX86_017104 [Deinandra increscens subsp. villosa]|uniref:Cytochrome P450 monooxygenase n=1 Tax=Deinandra increscens subsp. villosa TaxID=3103831 RepID=A0AAP0D1R1_9ASTR